MDRVVETVAKALFPILWKAECYNGVRLEDVDQYRIGGVYDMGGRVERYEQQAHELARVAIEHHTSALQDEIERLQETVRRVQASARSLTSTQTEIYEYYRKVSVINTEAVATLDSEREANAILTEELDAKNAEIAALREEITSLRR